VAGFRTTELTWLGHATFAFLTPESTRVLVDPWTFGNPMCREEDKDVGEVDLILITHAHHDHVGDVRRIAQAGSPIVVAIPELGRWLSGNDVRNVHTMNLGGIVELQGVEVTMTPAAHSSSLDDDPDANVGVAAGFVLGFSDGARVYHAGDTAAFAGMSILGEVHRPNLALLPMGDHHTMAPAEAAVAARLLDVPQVIPMHYGIDPTSLSAPDEFRQSLAGLHLDIEVTELTPGQRMPCESR
jgi:L-ascorbate metabolism protein UlaG (beta-lactamase superfamily)